MRSALPGVGEECPECGKGHLVARTRPVRAVRRLRPVSGLQVHQAGRGPRHRAVRDLPEVRDRNRGHQASPARAGGRSGAAIATPTATIRPGHARWLPTATVRTRRPRTPMVSPMPMEARLRLRQPRLWMGPRETAPRVAAGAARRPAARGALAERRAGPVAPVAEAPQRRGGSGPRAIPGPARAAATRPRGRSSNTGVMPESSSSTSRSAGSTGTHPTGPRSVPTSRSCPTAGWLQRRRWSALRDSLPVPSRDPRGNTRQRPPGRRPHPPPPSTTPAGAGGRRGGAPGGGPRPRPAQPATPAGPRRGRSARPSRWGAARAAVRQRYAHREAASADDGGARSRPSTDAGRRQGRQGAGGLFRGSTRPMRSARIPRLGPSRAGRQSGIPSGGALPQRIRRPLRPRCADRGRPLGHRLTRRRAPRRTRCGTRSRRTCWKAARTCAACRSCSATPAWRPPRSTPTSPTPRCGPPTGRRIRARRGPGAARRRGERAGGAGAASVPGRPRAGRRCRRC